MNDDLPGDTPPSEKAPTRARAKREAKPVDVEAAGEAVPAKAARNTKKAV